MKKVIALLLCAAMLTLSACTDQPPREEPQTGPTTQPEENTARNWEGASVIELSDREIAVTINDFTTKVAEVSPDQVVNCYAGQEGDAVVSVSRDIVYYQAGQDFTYGEGTEADAHSTQEAENHTVVTIRQPGTYVLRGAISAGQVAVDLGEGAEEDPSAVVTLVLDGVDITCTVAPAVIFYNVYECGDKDSPTKDVDTSAAGANVVIADGTENSIYGSYVARIYKPGTVELNEDGTEVAEAKKLHKYDGAFYSKMSMNVSGESGNSGVLSINAENEGLDSEMHLTINSGTISIISGNDGINTNEDGVSVTTINGGDLYILVAGTTGEGDGIDSNGWLVINGGTVETAACSDSADAGIDSDMGIHIGAGATIISTGHMLDRIESAQQNFAVFNFAVTRSGDEEVILKNDDGANIMVTTPVNDYSVLLYSSPGLTAGEYTLWRGETQLGHSGARMDGMGRPGGMQPPAWNEGERPQPPEGFEPGNMPMMPAQPPEGMELPEGMEPSGGGMAPGRGPGGTGGGQTPGQAVFAISGKENDFSGVGELVE